MTTELEQKDARQIQPSIYADLPALTIPPNYLWSPSSACSYTVRSTLLSKTAICHRQQHSVITICIVEGTTLVGAHSLVGQEEYSPFIKPSMWTCNPVHLHSQKLPVSGNLPESENLPHLWMSVWSWQWIERNICGHTLPDTAVQRVSTTLYTRSSWCANIWYANIWYASRDIKDLEDTWQKVTSVNK